MFSLFSKGYPQDKQITYAGMLWLLAAQIIVMAPLMFYLPIWLLPVLLFSAGWRIRVMKGHMEQPGYILKIFVMLLGMMGLVVSGLKPVSLDMMASLLILGFAYKSLEVLQRRDALVVIFTGFILVGVLFLYSQGMLTVLYGFFALAVLTGTMIAVQQSRSYAILPNLRLASLMLLLCLPLMLLFFIFAPRFAPLWSVPLSSGHAKTGISDQMTPGDIAKLSQSDALAFTANFTGERPRQNELYWRGLVLQHFDGNTWTQFEESLSFDEVKSRLRSDKNTVNSRLIKQGNERQYEMIYEKSARPWLFALTPVVDILNYKGNVFFASDNRLLAERDILEPMMLTLVSAPDSLRDLNLSESKRQRALQLPEKGNDQSRALAAQLFARSSSKQDYIEKVLERFKQQDFHYTLRPPTLRSENSIDDFLMRSKKGFCAHYSGSFVFLMRAAGIPARVVTGYQGGEWNEKGNFLSVRQYDAHAWAEVWLKGRGWVRFDPTSWVAPERVEKNLEAAVETEGSFLENKLLSMTKIKWLNSLRKTLDSTQYAWRRYVLGYDQASQAQFLKKLLGEITIQKVAIIVGGIFAGIILLWVLFLGLGKRHASEALEHQLYRRFCKLLEKKGITREPSQGPQQFGYFAALQLPALANEINAFSSLYTELCYIPNEQSRHKEQISQLKRLLKRIKKKN